MDAVTLKKVQDTVNEILFTLDDFCKKNDVKYYLFVHTKVEKLHHKV